MEELHTSLRKNPSRETCEGVIKRILMTEVLENGKNSHFKTAIDFMGYFESLYPASDALTKQVQRAIRSLDMPKDSDGYFIPNKTKEELAEEDELHSLLQKSNANLVSLEECKPVFLKTDAPSRSYLLHVIENSSIFEGQFVTAQETATGILFYTKTPSQFENLLNHLIVR